MDASRDNLWLVIYESYYDCYYAESSAVFMVGRLQAVDTLNKCLLALFSTGSALAGWALWSDESWKWLWSILAGLSIVFSILHSALSITRRLEAFTETKAVFTDLRIGFETALQRMKIDPNFNVAPVTQEYEAFRARYSQAMQKWPQDVFYFRRDQLAVQENLNRKLRTYASENSR